MVLSKTMRMFALVGLLVPVVSLSMETANAVVDAAIGVGSSSNGSAGQSRRTVRRPMTRQLKPLVRRPANRVPSKISSRVSTLSSFQSAKEDTVKKDNSWSFSLSTKAKYALIGAVALPAALLGFAYAFKKIVNKPFPAVSPLKMSLWALLGGLIGYTDSRAHAEDRRIAEAHEKANDESEFSAAYTSAIQATKEPSKQLVKSTCTVNPEGRVNMTFGV